MGGPIVRTGTTPKFWENYDRIFNNGGTKKAATAKKETGGKAEAKSAKKAPAKKAKAAAKKKK